MCFFQLLITYFILRAVYVPGEEDPRRYIILAPFVFCIQFTTCKGLYPFFADLALGSS